MRLTVFALLATLFLVSLPAASEWIFFFETIGGHKFFIDPETIKKGVKPKAWFRATYANTQGGGEKSSKILLEADCVEDKIRGLAIRNYGERDDTLSSTDAPTAWSHITPDSFHDEAYKILCKFRNK